VCQRLGGSSEDRFAQRHYYRKTALFDRLLHFDVTTDPARYLVQRFLSSNHIGITRKPRPEEPADLGFTRDQPHHSAQVG
jgi:hypothetical protein